jgi:putative ABC transport system permease protein
VDKGFDPTNVFTARVALPSVRYPEKEDALRFYRQLQERVRRLPGVQVVSVANIVPLGGNSWERGIWPEGTPTDAEHTTSVLFNMVPPDHFEAMGIPILRGRGFTDADREGAARVCIIDETMAEKFWPGEDPIGQRVTFEIEPGHDFNDDNAPRIYRTVVGVTKNTRHYELESPSRVQVYVPLEQSGGAWTTAATLIVKTARDPLALTPAVWREVGAIDKDVPVQNIQTMQGYVDAALSGKTVVGGILSLFSGLALALSAIGIFGVMSISVVQRLRDFGIHMALGARAGDILRMVAREGLTITITGVVIGAAAAAGLTRFMRSLLYQVNPVEPTTYVAVAVGLVGVALLAAYLPARRATKVDPAVVLKQE